MYIFGRHHGELNPSNILLKASNSSSEGNVQAKVTAFGVTPIKSSIYRTKSGNQNGEILFAMLGFELLTGKVPFEDDYLQGDKMPDAPPLVDYCDIETGYLNKFSEAGTPSLDSISQSPFQIFAYKLVEKEKTSSSLKEKGWDLANESFLTGIRGQILKEDVDDNIFLQENDQSPLHTETFDNKVLPTSEIPEKDMLTTHEPGSTCLENQEKTSQPTMTVAKFPLQTIQEKIIDIGQQLKARVLLQS
ncbi:hypothetical protein POM88_033380 [Heracleum sosnowskyi]|uniref:Protein kinase domain-containing protein n=1 Tax=Heracleum sosnowskyi TaxID=360622 RepID=A0AAD8I360_9APIA|nr:hypothetical protein POM88_033380 [Heracleum sosnowskyi]